VADELPPLVASLTGDDSGFSEMVDRAEGNVDRLKEALDELGAKHDEATVGLDGTEGVIGRLDDLDARLDEYGHKHETATVDVDSGGMADIEGPSMLLPAILALGPALIPLGGELAAVGAGGAAAFTSIGLAAGVAYLAMDKIKAEAKTVLTPALHELQATAAHGLMPGFTDLLHDLLPLVPAVDHLVGDLSKTMGGLARQLGGELDSGGAKQFIGFLDKMAGPTLTTAVHVIENFGKGLAGMAEASLPLVNELGRGVLDMSKHFAKFGQDAGSDSFQGFLHYLEAEGPPVARALGDIGKAVGHLIGALAPMGSLSLGGLDEFAKLIDRLPADDIRHVAEAVTGVAIGMKAVSAVTFAAGAIEALASPAGLAAVGIAALGYGLYEAYEKSQPFRQAVNEIASTIEGDAIPAFHALEGFVSGTLEPVLDRIANDALKGLTHAVNDVDGALKSNHPQIVQLGHALQDVGDVLTRDVLPVLGPLFAQAIEVEGTKIKIAIDVIGDLVRAFDGAANVVKGLPGDFSSAWHAIDNAVHTGIADVEGVFEDFASNAPGMLVAAGESIISGLASGIENGISHFLGGALGKVTSFIHAHKGPIEYDRVMLEPAGQAIMQGLADGIDHGTARVGGALAKVSKLIDEGLIGGWAGEASKLKDAMSTPLQEALSAFEAHAKAMVSAQESAVKKSQSTLESAIKARASAAESLKQTIGAGADISNFTTTDTAGNTIPSNIAAGLQAQLGPLKEFATLLAQLRKSGLGAGLLSQVANLGPTQGIEVAEQILSGQDGSVQSLNATEASVQRYAGQAASLTENAVYAKQISSDRKDVHRQTVVLEDIRQNIRKMAERDAKDLALHLTVDVDKDGKYTIKDARGIQAALNQLNRTRGSQSASSTSTAGRTPRGSA
jgi:phage-related protein